MSVGLISSPKEARPRHTVKAVGVDVRGQKSCAPSAVIHKRDRWVVSEVQRSNQLDNVQQYKCGRPDAIEAKRR